MRPAFNVPEYQAGFEFMRQTLLQGLGQLQPGQGAQSWTIGAYCALVRLIWDRRNPESGRVQVAAVLATVLADVLREAEGEPQDAENGIATMLEAFNAAAVACSPRDSQGQVLADGDVIIHALGTYVAQLLFTLPREARYERVGEFATFVESVLDRLEIRRRQGQPAPFAPVVLEGGRK